MEYGQVVPTCYNLGLRGSEITEQVCNGMTQ